MKPGYYLCLGCVVCEVPDNGVLVNPQLNITVNLDEYGPLFYLIDYSVNTSGSHDSQDDRRRTAGDTYLTRLELQ